VPPPHAVAARLSPTDQWSAVRSWVLTEDGRFKGYAKPSDAGKAKPKAEFPLSNVYVDIPGSSSARKDQFNLIPLAMGKAIETFYVDTDTSEEDTLEWTQHLAQVIGAVNPGESWSKNLSKTVLQVWSEVTTDKDTGDTYTAFMFRIKRADGEWGFKQRYSGLQKWHTEFVVPAHDKAAPKFPGKHAVAKKGDKFVETRRQDLSRYFVALLGIPGFMESDEFDMLIDRQKNAAFSHAKKASSEEVQKAVAAVEEAHEEFDVSTLEAPEEWVNLHRSPLPETVRHKPRLLFQEEEWGVLDDEQLDLATYELIFLTVGTSSSLLSPKERGILELVRSKLGITRRKLNEISHIMLDKAADEEEEGGAVDLRGSTMAREGTLDLLDKKGKGKRWMFRLSGLNLEYYKTSGSSAKLQGTIDLDLCTGCRSEPHPNDVAASKDTMLIECQGGVQYYLKADSEEMVREWIKQIWDALQAKAAAAEEFDEEDEGNEAARMLEHRFRMLQERNYTDFDSPESFLRWRRRQVVIFASGMAHTIDCYRAWRPNYDTKLEAVQKKITNQFKKMLEHETGKDDVAWVEADEMDYQERLERIARLVGEAYDEGRNASTDGEEYMQWYPLSVSTVLYERALLKTCFEDPEDGGDVDMEAEQIYALLQKMSARLGYMPGMHDVCFAVAVVEQYKLAKDPVQLELLESTVRSKLATPFEASELRVVGDQYELLQKFCSDKLMDYHQVEDSSHIGSFVEVFMMLQQCKPSAASAGDGADEAILAGFINSSIEKNYEVVRERAKEISDEREVETGEKETPMQRFAVFVEELQEEMDAELIEYAAYVGIHHSQASGVAGVKMADLLNIDLRHHFKDVDEKDPDVMETWAQLRGMEMKIMQAMESCGHDAASAKVLRLDDAMSGAATKWVDEKTEMFQDRMRTAIERETWEPVSDDQYMAASALDIFSMLVQVAQGYFQAEFPVAEPVMKDLATKFGMILQTYCRICVQQCGEMPNLHAGREAVRGQGLEGGLAAAGKLGGMIGGRAMEAAKQARLLAAGLIDEEGNQLGTGDEMAAAGQEADLFQWSGPDLANLAVRFGTVQYMSDSCQRLMQIIVDGAENQNYTGAPLDTVMDSTKEALRQHGMTLANHIGANVVCVKLHTEFDALYVPYPTDSNVQQCIDGLDQTLDDVMPRIPPDYTKFVIEQVFEKVLEVMLKHVNAWRSGLSRNQTPLTAEDCDTVDSDLEEVCGYFTFGGEGLDDEQIEAKAKRLQRTVCCVWRCVACFSCWHLFELR
jgi:hypothetical protein